MEQKVLQLAEAVRQAGGRALLVGGCVRDEILKKDVKDYDCEVYGLPVDELEKVLSAFGEVNKVGKQFAVYKLGQDIDVSLPRREKKTGKGHKGFEIVADPFMSYEEACSRRDFTINAMLKDPLTGRVIDPLGGVYDLEMKTLRAVSETAFQEDSLRVLRLAQFASRFNFDIDNKTFRMAVATDLSDLPKERVWMEVEKLLLKSVDPSLGVRHLVDLKVAEKCFPAMRLEALVKSPAVMEALQRAPRFCYDLFEFEKLAVLSTLLAYCATEEGLDQLGLNSVDGYNVRKKVEAILETLPVDGLKTDYEFHKLAQKVPMRLLHKVICAFPRATEFANRFGETIERLGIQETSVKPIVTGKHLLERGAKAGKELGDVLKEVYEMQIKGVEPERLYQRAYYALGLKYQTAPVGE